MTGMFGRLSSIADTSSDDQEKANSVLMELDKGLRSSKTGEQCEAIIRFPSLFEKFPFPVVINSSFLKLGDVFRVGSNLLRLCILRITQQSKKHLDKILNVDEFLRKIYSVIHSNDPVARAITLRLLGSTAPVIADRKNVHHSIIGGLKSHDQVEVEAAVFAARCFTAQSKSFAGSVLEQLSQVITRLSTPVDMKLKLIPVLQHMHREPQTAAKVRELCTTLLSEYESRAFVLTTLHTLSLLSARCLSDINLQVELLQQYLMEDPRLSVRTLCLQDLTLLAQRAPHMWQPDNIRVLCEFLLTCSDDVMVTGSLKVLNKLAHSIAVSNFSTSPDSPEMECVIQTCYHDNLEIAALGSSVLVYLAIHCHKTSLAGGSSLEDEACTALETLMSVLSSAEDNPSQSTTQMCLRCVVEICQACPQLTDRFIDTLRTVLPNLQGDRVAVFYECFLAVCSQHNELLAGLVPDVLDMLKVSQSNKHTVLSLVTLLFQGSVEEGLSSEVTSVIREAVTGHDGWLVYRIARQATRYGHHPLAAQLFGSLCAQVSSEQNYYWLSGLREISRAENCLLAVTSTEGHTSVPRLMEGLTEALSGYHQCRASLRAATTPEFLHIFQLEYVRLRTKMLESFVQLLHACCSYRTSPPPATATALATTTGLDLHKCGHVLSQMKACASQFMEVHHDYVSLYQTAFDADHTSLANIQILQQMCRLMTQVLESTTTITQSEVSTPRDFGLEELGTVTAGGATEHQRWNIAKQAIHRLVSVAAKEPSNTLTYKHLQCTEQTVAALCSIPLSLPRFFFQKLQHTTIKLALSPQPASPSEPLSIHYDTCLSLKMEGVIERGHSSKRSRTRELRKINQIKLRVNSTQLSRGQLISEGKAPDSHSNSLTQVTEPHNDYFCCQFILSFPVPGLHEVTMETVVLDNSSMEWNTGPSMTVQVKSYDEAVQRQQQQQYAAQRQQQRAAAATAVSS